MITYKDNYIIFVIAQSDLNDEKLHEVIDYNWLNKGTVNEFLVSEGYDVKAIVSKHNEYIEVAIIKLDPESLLLFKLKYGIDSDTLYDDMMNNHIAVLS